MVTKPQNPKKNDPLKDQTPPGPGSKDVALTSEEKKELEELREKKTQFSESSKEGIRLAKLVKDLEEKLAIASATPSEEELKQKYPDFEDMDSEEKAKAVEDLKKEKRLKILEAKEKMREDYNSLPQNVREKIEKKEGGFNSFKDFACSPENAGQKDLLNIAKAYLFDETPETPVTPETPTTPGLEDGTGGLPTEEPLKEGFTTEELKNMRVNEPEKYRRLAKAGKLKMKE